eukprot:TRINITY_DN103299_c0_g1_i1.p1 TRINITY_DN103299_c0_g1~~TRINITY_DN103299_c0_g1_i1.p1  ORF type:complete len:327 (-),score=65.14 TRINITY_DN103299_c0_g1_i1:196-1176(-)
MIKVPNVNRLGRRKVQKLMDQGIIPPNAGGRMRYSENDILNSIEVDKTHGARFRCWFYLLVILIVMSLSYLKWYVDVEMEPDLPPDIVKAKEEKKKVYEEMGVKTETQYKQKVAEMEKELEKEDCEDCKQKLVALKDTESKLATIVDVPYEEVLKIDRRAGAGKIREAFKKAKKEAEEGKSNYELAELQEAYNIMSHPEARQFYHLYGTKPPDYIKHRPSNKHGGWGVEMGLGTFKYILVMAWLDYFNDWKVEVGFFLFITLIVGLKAWGSMDEFMEKVKQIEEMEQMQREERDKEEAELKAKLEAARAAQLKKEAKMERKLHKGK